MDKFQVIKEKNAPKFVVLPFGDREAVEDYLDELWALQSLKKWKSKKNPTFHELRELDSLISEKEELMEG